MNLVTLHHVGVAYDGYEALKNSNSSLIFILTPHGRTLTR